MLRALILSMLKRVVSLIKLVVTIRLWDSSMIVIRWGLRCRYFLILLAFHCHRLVRSLKLLFSFIINTFPLTSHHLVILCTVLIFLLLQIECVGLTNFLSFRLRSPKISNKDYTTFHNVTGLINVLICFGNMFYFCNF